MAGLSDFQQFLILLGLFIALFIWAAKTGKKEIGEMKQKKHRPNALGNKQYNGNKERR